MHDCPLLLNLLVDHDCLGEGLLNRAHLDLLLHVGVFNFCQDGLELGLLLVGVLVSDGLRLFWNLCSNLLCASAVSLASASAVAGVGIGLIKDLIEVWELSSGLVHDLLFAPRVEVIIGEEPIEFISFISCLDQVGSIHDVTARSLTTRSIGTALSDGTRKATGLWFGNLLLGNLDRLDNTFLEVDWLAHR